MGWIQSAVKCSGFALAILSVSGMSLTIGGTAQASAAEPSTTVDIGQSVVLNPGTFCLANEVDGAFIYDLETPFRWPIMRPDGQPAAGQLVISNQSLDNVYSLALDHGYYLDTAGNIEVKLPNGQYGTDWNAFQNSPTLSTGFSCGGVAGSRTTPVIVSTYGTGPKEAFAATGTAPPALGSAVQTGCETTPATTADAIICETNKARMNPAAVAAGLRERLQYYNGNRFSPPGQVTMVTIEGRIAVEEAIRFLENQKPLAPLAREQALALAAEDWVKAQGPTGGSGHISADGKQPADRVIARGGKKGWIGENISYGPFSAAAHVVQLIIDDGVSNRGHRDNIYKADYVATGVSCGPHNSQYKQMCVMVYSNAQ